MKRKAFIAALHYTLPICIGFMLLGMSYGFLMKSRGFPFVYPLLMSLFIFAGSMEFVTVDLLLSAFDPVSAFLLALTVNARHIFYGISMLSKYRGTGIAKLYLIFGLCDETFSVNSTVSPPSDADPKAFMLFVTLFNHIYWVCGAVFGALLGYVIHFNTDGIEFVMTALFVVMLTERLEKKEYRVFSLIGILCTLGCLIVIGSEHFILPSMLLITACIAAAKKPEAKEK